MTRPEHAMSALQHALADYPRRMADLTARAAVASTATVVGEDEGGLVTVTATGAGEILSVRVTVRALRELDPQRLAQRVTTAANVALARAEATLNGAAGVPAVPDDTAEQLAEFEGRMDESLDRLNDLDRRLDRLIDEP